MNWRGHTPKLYRLVPQFYKSGCAVITLVDVTMSVLGHCSLVPEFIHWIDRCLFVADISLVVFMSVRLFVYVVYSLYIMLHADVASMQVNIVSVIIYDYTCVIVHAVSFSKCLLGRDCYFFCLCSYLKACVDVKQRVAEYLHYRVVWKGHFSSYRASAYCCWRAILI